MSDVESVQAGSVYVIKPIVGPRESERVRWPDGVGRFASLEDATDGASFYRVQPEIDGLLSDEYALVPVADAELTGEVYEWGTRTKTRQMVHRSAPRSLTRHPQRMKR
jgi:hypothetical protein